MVVAEFFRWVGEKLSLLGRQISFATSLFLFIIIGLILKGSFEHNNMNAPAISGSTPNVKGLKLHTLNDFNNGSQNYLPKQGLQLVPGTLLSTNVSLCEVNVGLVRRSYSKLTTWCSNVKTNVLSGGFEYAAFLTYELLKHLISLLTLVLVLVGMLFGLMERRPSFGIWVVIIVSILGFILKCLNGPPLTLFHYGFATLIYDLGQVFIVLAVMLMYTQKELSHLFAGTAYACFLLALLDYTFSFISSEYACVGVAVVFFFVLFAAISGFTPNRAD